jgi:8-oxo-dGTP pyrophosphatase MutT (NUDIX family)
MHEESFGIIPLMKEGHEWKVFLILHRSAQHWTFPKGRALISETPLETARRELQEETQLEVVRLLHEKPVIEEYQFYRGAQKVLKKASYFLAVVQGEVKLQEEEVSDGKWLSLQEALSQLTFKEARVLCTEVIAILKSI